MVKPNSYDGYGDSIRRQVFKLLETKPSLKPKPICKRLGLSYEKHGQYVANLRSHWKSNYDYGSALKAQNPHRRVFVWECVNGDRSQAVEHGWVEVANRNGVMVYRGDRGSVHWYKGGLVRLYLRGAVQVARAKELFCRAFRFLDDETLMPFVDAPLREESRHWVFEVGAHVPRFDIRKFERSHGIRIYADKSHRTAIEVEETQPFWIDELKETLAEFGDVQSEFGVNIKEHLRLIKMWQSETVARDENARNRHNPDEHSQCTSRVPLSPVYLGKNRFLDPTTKTHFIRVGHWKRS